MYSGTPAILRQFLHKTRKANRLQPSIGLGAILAHYNMAVGYCIGAQDPYVT